MYIVAYEINFFPSCQLARCSVLTNHPLLFCLRKIEIACELPVIKLIVYQISRVIYSCMNMPLIIERNWKLITCAKAMLRPLCDMQNSGVVGVVRDTSNFHFDTIPQF